MSMTDLFGSDEGSDVEGSDDENSENMMEAAGKQEAHSSSDDQSGEEGGGDGEEEEDQEDEGNKEDDEEEKDERQEEEIDEEKSEQDDDDQEHKNDSENEGSSEEEVEKEEKQSNNEDDEKPAGGNKNVSSMDLFGEDVSSEEDEDEVERGQESATQDQENVTDSFQQHDLGSDEEQQEEQPEETQINVEIPYCKFSLGSEMAFVKLPNFLSVETKPFDLATYEDEFEEDEVMDDEGRSRLKLRVENTIRWRNARDDEGNDIKESNARVVRWSDGTMSLLLGAEVFDIHKTKIDGEHNHLFVQQGTGLQAQAIFREKLTFRPHSTNSQTHRKMTLSIADRVSKTGKIKILPVVGKDPESQKGELIKKEEEKLRSELRKENQQRRMRERSNARGLTASYLEPDRYDDDEEALEQSLLEMKKHYKKGLAKSRLGDMYSDQESEEEGISGGLESDDDSAENSADKGAGMSESDSTRQRKHSFEEAPVKKKRKKVIAESDEDESD